MSSKKGILKTDVPKFVVEDTTVPHVSASPDNHESNKLITGTNRTPPTEMDNAANLSVKSTRNLQRKQKTGTGSYDSGQTVSESLGTSHAAKTTTKGITWDDLESTTDYKEELLNRSDDSQSKNSRETNKQTSYTVSNNSSRTLKSGAESSAPYLEQPPTLSATDSRQTGRKQLSVSGVTQSASKDGNSSRHPETAVRMGGVGKNRQSGIGGKNSGSVEQTASGIQTKSVGERSSKEVFTESQWRPHMDTGVVSQRSTVRTSVVKDSQVSPEVSSVRDDAPSREDNLSLVDESEDAGRKFTSKKTAHKSNFGSSTTLSSATEVSDDNDTDVFQVVLRVRPLSVQEKQRRDNFAVTFPGDGKCAVDNSGSQRSFQFNTVFEPDATQEDVFENSGIKRLVDNAVAGYNCTAFAFGQTGSGKTHTMTGPPAQFHQVGVTPDPNMYGIIQRSFKYMYQLIKQQGGGKVIRASYLEVYNEQVIDLLNNSHRRYLSVRWSKNRGFYVENLFTIECEALDDVMAVLEEGLRNRQTGSHGLNEFSSRSHSVLTVTIDSETQPDSEDDNLYVTKRGKLSFVDLAGSEKVKDASGGNAVGPGILESNSINKSLLVLGNCISHLADAKRRQGHIPYRDSKLTKLLSDSLGGNGITLMIACITPSSANITETMNTLRYASRAKKIKTKPTVKMDPREKLILSLKREIKVLRNENHYLRQQLDFPAKPKGQLQKENDEKFMKFMKEQQQKESGLYEMLQEYMVENENLRAENSEMHSTRDRIRREQQLLYRENEKLMKRMEEMERTISQNPAFWSAVHHPNRTDGYGQMDVIVPTNQPLLGYQSGHSQKGYTPPVGPASPPGSRGRPILPGPIKPPHRLPEPVMRPAQRPAEVVHNGEAMYPNNGFVSPRLAPRQVSPTRNIERNPSQLSTTDAIHSMNEQLKREVMQLEGEIRHHQHARGDRGSQDVKRSSVNNSLTAR